MTSKCWLDIARLECWNSASVVGGKFSMSLLSRSFLSLSTCSSVLPLLYRTTLNLWRRPNIWDCLLKSRNGSRAIVANAVVTSWLINWCTEKRTEHLSGAYCWYWCSYQLGKFSLLHKINSDAAIWVALGTGRNFKYLQINAVSRSLGEEKSLAMPYFHWLWHDIKFL